MVGGLTEPVPCQRLSLVPSSWLNRMESLICNTNVIGWDVQIRDKDGED